MIFNKENYHDIVKYYTGNIIKLPKETGDRLWLITNINSNEVSMTDCDGFNIYLDLNDSYEVDFPLPGRAVYQSGDKACFLFRKPAKQYNRGIHNQNTGILALDFKGSWHTVPIHINTLQQFVDKPCYQTLTPDLLDSPLFSIALNQYFSVCKLGHLFCLNKQIGDIILKDQKVILYNSLFLPEVSSLLPTWSVVNNASL